MDGKEVGREIRHRQLLDGPAAGPLVQWTSHQSLRYKMGGIRIEKKQIKTEQSALESGKLHYSSHIGSDPVTNHVTTVFRNESHWERLRFSNSRISPAEVAPERFQLDDVEIFGMRLNETLRHLSHADADAPLEALFFDSLLAQPTPITATVSPGGSFRVSPDSPYQTARQVEVRLTSTDQVILRSHFDTNGNLLVEEYPIQGERRVRLAGAPAPSDSGSELVVGFHSRAYLGDPNAANRAVFSISAATEDPSVFELLELPVNQSLETIEPGMFALQVLSGAPDGREPPDSADLASSRYIRPNSHAVQQALLYLRSAGKKGSLPKARRNNAVPVIARASYVKKDAAFWSDPTEVARLVMRYVHALLPDKRHTFGMADAVTTLRRGAGDCTEHGVLFASLMRAHGVPTRLVTGMYLTPGGIWAYHLWNEYWDGTRWRALDAATQSADPGALYVALGRGVPRFSDIRDDLSLFMRRTFNNISFDLTEAYQEGEELRLARPRTQKTDLHETYQFNALVLSNRGDHAGALSVLDKHLSYLSQPITARLMRIEFLVGAERYQEALADIADLREGTSSSANTDFLDRMEFLSLLALGRNDEAGAILKRLEASPTNDASDLTELRAELAFGTAGPDDAIRIIEDFLQSNPPSSSLKLALSRFHLANSTVTDDEGRALALEAAEQAVFLSLHADPEALRQLALTLRQLDRPEDALRAVDQALILQPASKKLLRLRHELKATNGNSCNTLLVRQ